MVQYIRSNLVKCTVRDRYGKETARIMEVKQSNIFLTLAWPSRGHGAGALDGFVLRVDLTFVPVR